MQCSGVAVGPCTNVLQNVYMSAPKRVGVRELRQNLSVYLDRVRAGEVLEVTERGKPVARLTPPPTGEEWLDRLIAEGKARPPRRSWESLPPPVKLEGPMPITEALEEQRRERL